MSFTYDLLDFASILFDEAQWQKPDRNNSA
jgi:hypothetical protein